jgi:hypothetical protein
MRKYIVILLVFMTVQVCHAANAWNLGILRGELRQMLRDTDSANYRWSSTLLNERFAMAEEEFCRRTLAVKTQNYIVTVTSQTEYAMPGGWLKTDRMARAIKPLRTSTTRYTEIDYVTVTWLDSDKGRPFFEDAAPDIPQRFYINLNTQKIGLDPPPNKQYTGTNLIKHEYTIASSSMSADSDVPFDNVPYLYTYHKGLIFYVLSLCEKDIGNNNSSVGWLQVFDAYIERAKEQLNFLLQNNSGNFTPK